MQGKIPTRDEVQVKIDALIADSTKNKEDYEVEIRKWLTSLNLQPVVVAGQTIDPVEQIINDLDGYRNY